MKDIRTTWAPMLVVNPAWTRKGLATRMIQGDRCANCGYHRIYHPRGICNPPKDALIRRG